MAWCLIEHGAPVLSLEWYDYYKATNKLHGAVHLEKLTVTLPVKKLPAFHGTRDFIVSLTACYLSLS
jgi:hypothetical protein